MQIAGGRVRLLCVVRQRARARNRLQQRVRRNVGKRAQLGQAITAKVSVIVVAEAVGYLRVEGRGRRAVIFRFGNASAPVQSGGDLVFARPLGNLIRELFFRLVEASLAIVQPGGLPVRVRCAFVFREACREFAVVVDRVVVFFAQQIHVAGREQRRREPSAGGGLRSHSVQVVNEGRLVILGARNLAEIVEPDGIGFARDLRVLQQILGLAQIAGAAQGGAKCDLQR